MLSRLLVVRVPLQVWDMNMESRPVEVYPVHDYLRSRLCSLYENDSIFDRFECSWNGDDTYPYLTEVPLPLPPSLPLSLSPPLPLSENSGAFAH